MLAASGTPRVGERERVEGRDGREEEKERDRARVNSSHRRRERNSQSRVSERVVGEQAQRAESIKSQRKHLTRDIVGVGSGTKESEVFLLG